MLVGSALGGPYGTRTASDDLGYHPPVATVFWPNTALSAGMRRTNRGPRFVGAPHFLTCNLWIAEFVRYFCCV